MATHSVRPARPGDIPALAGLRATLWPDGSVQEHEGELEAQVPSTSDLTLVAESAGTLIGFLEARLRSHADGCTTSPVGYLEGWFVTAEWRRQGVGRALFERFESWARERGCRELASDTWLDNTASQRAHERLGFTEVDRVVNYRKALGPVP